MAERYDFVFRKLGEFYIALDLNICFNFIVLYWCLLLIYGECFEDKDFFCFF